MRMIVDSMSLKEIHDVAREDTKALLDIIEAKFPAEYKRELIRRKPKTRIAFKPITIERPNGIKWIVRYVSDNYAQFKREGINFVLYGVFSYYGATYTLFPVNLFKQYTFYPPHFFERYRERHLKDETVALAEARDSFFKHNYSAVAQKLSDDSNEIISTEAEGTALGVQYTDGMVIWKTFVSPEMLYLAQERLRKDALSRLTIHEIDKNFIDVPGHGY